MASDTRTSRSRQGEAPAFPLLLTARQVYPEAPDIDVRAESRRQVASLLAGLPKDARVAVTVGSRGIDRLAG
ncbi:MAG: hypothetical protein D6766_02795, partial [Verrucomicrobia bacterium]